jgi:hypothetical protein
MAGLTLTPDERIAALERRVADAEFYATSRRFGAKALSARSVCCVRGS